MVRSSFLKKRKLWFMGFCEWPDAILFLEFIAHVDPSFISSEEV